MKLRRKNTFLPIALVLIVAGCADARLVEGPDVEQADVEESEENVDHLHEDGNWYAGWAVTVSEELTDVTTVEDDLLIIPRDEIFDLELSILSPMDIIVGASENNGFLKRVLKVEADENQWEITVEDAQLQDVFLEGSFRFDSAAVNGVDTQPFRQELQGEGPRTEAGSEQTRRQPLSTAFVEESLPGSCGSDCDSTQSFSLGGGISATFNPQVEFIERSSSDGAKSRFIFEFENVFPHNKRKSRSMCTSLSRDLARFQVEHRKLVDAYRDGSSGAKEIAVEGHAQARFSLYTWALKYAGHSPFPPFILNGDGAIIQQHKTGSFSECLRESLGWLESSERGCKVTQDGNTFFVTMNGEQYELLGSQDDRIYKAMTPDFRSATHDVSNLIHRRPGIGEVFETHFPPHLRGLAASAVRSRDTAIEHRNQQWLHSSVDLIEFDEAEDFTLPALTNLAASEGFERSTAELERMLRGNHTISKEFRRLRNRGILEDLNWFAASIGVGKLYCSGADLTSARMGAGARLDFTHAPKLGLEFGASGSASASAVKSTEKDLKLFNSSKVFAVGPVPVQIDVVGTLGVSVTAQITGKIEAEVRRHRGEVDFFYGMEYENGSWKPLSLAEKGPTDDDITGGNTIKLLESPTIESKEDYFKRPLIDLSGSLSGKIALETGIGLELILYKTFGIGAGVNLTKELGVGLDTSSGLKVDATMGPTAKIFSSLKLPLCQNDSCGLKEALADFCKFPPHNETPVCGGGYDCEERPYLCPTFSGADGEVKLQIPMFNSCNWFPWTAEADCKNSGWSDPILRPFPPCFKACYRSQPSTGNRWIALIANTSSSPHYWARLDDDDLSTVGIPVDSIRTMGLDGDFARPEVVKVDDDAISSRQMRKLEPCRQSGCGRDLNSCEASHVRESLLHFRSSMFLKFERDLRPGDIIEIVEQHIARSTSQDLNECGGQVSYDIAVGSAEGDGCWKTLGTKSEGSLFADFQLSESSFASKPNCELENEDIIQ